VVENGERANVGKKGKAALILGTKRNTLYNKLERMKL
jgi:DNA-binding protein Fis